MSETPSKPRRPLVPGPSTPLPLNKPTRPEHFPEHPVPQQGPSISERAIAVRQSAPAIEAALRESGALRSEASGKGELRSNGGTPGLGPRPVLAFVPEPIGQITAAVAAVMSEVGTIQKTGYNAFHRYKYASMGDVFHAVTPLMGKHGIMYTQTEIEVKAIENNRLSILYEFVFSHASGERLPPIRFSSLVMARDSKGNYDDKAINKGHSNARKYVVIGLFNIPAGDFDDPDADADGDNANQRKEPVPGPGPYPSSAREAPAGSVQAAADKAVKTLKEIAGPHPIRLGAGAGADQWAGAFIRAIEGAATEDEVRAWDKENDKTLQGLSDKYPGVYEMVEAAMQRRLAQLAPSVPSDAMPDPKLDDGIAATNWVAEQLAGMMSYEAAEAFWNQVVAPREKEFDMVDWGMLLQEWERTSQRLDPPEDDPPEAA